MVKLTDSQLIVLSAAAARDDGLAVAPTKMTKAATSKVGASLVAHKLMREMPAKPGMPVWRHDEGGRPISLMITKAGKKAIGVEEAETVEKVGGETKPDGARRTAAPAASGSATHAVQKRDPIATPRANSKQALIIDMLSKADGVTIDALIKATGWLPHTTRAALTGLRKRGFEIVRTPRDKGGSIYRIAASSIPGGAGLSR
jgi:hypothetical protein